MGEIAVLDIGIYNNIYIYMDMCVYILYLYEIAVYVYL